MTDTTNVDAVPYATPAPSLSQIVAIAVTKAKATVDIDLNAVPDDMYQSALKEGIKVMVNSGMSKVTVKDVPDEAQRTKMALDIAKENVQKILESKMKLGRQTSAAKGVPGAVMTEARRLCKDVIKAEIKAAGMKVSHVDPRKITEAANEMLKDATVGPTYIAQAEANLAARGKLPGASTDAAEAQAKLASLGVSEDPAKVAKAYAEKAKRKQDVPLSAKQAGMSAARAQASATH